MSVKSFTIELVNRAVIRSFIETHHYSKSINGCIADYCFALYDNDVMVGAMFYGRMAMAGQYRRFSDDEKKVIELRRLCCIDDTPKNTESYFIGGTLKWLRANTTIEKVVSYSDMEYGHVGTIYRASNFKCLGASPGARVILYNGKKYHDKAIRTKYKGELKPFAKRLKTALDTGEATYQSTKGKLCYVYDIKRKHCT